MKLHVCTLFWDANSESKSFSRMYDESWVEKLYRGFRKHLTQDFTFVCYTDKKRVFSEPSIEQEVIPSLGVGGYADCIKPYALNEPMILCGLDTVVVSNIDHLGMYAVQGGKFALPRDPYKPNIACNGVALVPGGMRRIYDEHRGENDMEHVRRYSHDFIDDVFPGQVKSYKGHVKRNGWTGVKIVYFHGLEKPHELSHSLIKDNWK